MDPKKKNPDQEFDEEFSTSEREEGILDPNLMGELWDEEPGVAAPEEEPTVEEPEEGDEESGTEDGEEFDESEEPDEEEEVEEPEDEQKRYKVKDKEYDLETLAREGLLDDLITQASQVAHFQRLYEEEKAAREAQGAQQAQPPQPQFQPQQQPISIEQVKAAMAPHVANSVREGFLEEDFVAVRVGNQHYFVCA